MDPPFHLLLLHHLDLFDHANLHILFLLVYPAVLFLQLPLDDHLYLYLLFYQYDLKTQFLPFYRLPQPTPLDPVYQYNLLYHLYQCDHLDHLVPVHL